MRLFKKCAKTGTRILSVFKYKIVIQIAKINADIILPKLCRAANKTDEINIEKVMGRINFNLFNKTPLKINSSETGEIKTTITNP